MVPQIGTRQSSYLGSYLGSTTCPQTSNSEPVGGVFQKPSKSFSKKLRSLRDRCGRRFRLPGSRKGGLHLHSRQEAQGQHRILEERSRRPRLQDRQVETAHLPTKAAAGFNDPAAVLLCETCLRTSRLVAAEARLHLAHPALWRRDFPNRHL